MINKKIFAKNYLKNISDLSVKINLGDISSVIRLIELARKKNRQIFVAGNGGSAATASHMVCDLNKTVLGKNLNGNKRRFRFISLSDNVPWVTALGNDCSFDVVFSEQLKNMARKNDVLLVITGSGNSKNIIEAVKTAKDMGLRSIGFLGFDGGEVKKMLDKYVLIPSSHYGLVEDYHMILDHLITEYFKNQGN